MTKMKAESHQLSQKTWVVLPAYNEEYYITDIITQIRQYTDNVIVVDDGSSDETYNLASEQVKHVLRHVINLGKGSAIKTGCEYAFNHCGAEAVILMDADAQHDPSELMAFQQELNNDRTLILGVRKLDKNMPFLRRKGNKILSLAVSLLYGVYVPDILSGYKAFNKDVFQRLNWYSKAYGVEMELAIRIAHYKLPFTTVPIKTIYHDYDRGMTLLDTFELFVQLITWRLFI